MEKMTYPVDSRLFAQLAARRPQEVVMPPVCEYNDEEKSYSVTVWGSPFTVWPHRHEIRPVEKSGAHEYFPIFLVNYLLAKKRPQASGRWISEKDLPGGTTFFRGPHAIPTDLIVQRYGDDIEALRQKCQAMGAVSLDMADCAFSFEVVGSVKIALLYWRGDEDFPAEAKLLFDSSVAETMPLDVVYALLCDACVRIASEAKG